MNEFGLVIYNCNLFAKSPLGLKYRKGLNIPLRRIGTIYIQMQNAALGVLYYHKINNPYYQSPSLTTCFSQVVNRRFAYPTFSTAANPRLLCPGYALFARTPITLLHGRLSVFGDSLLRYLRTATHALAFYSG